jgi:hypothetical protein
MPPTWRVACSSVSPEIAVGRQGCGEADEQQHPIAEPGEGIRDRPGASARQYHYVLFKEVPNGQDG